MNEEHINYMSQALQLAELGRYTVSPNPLVGCLIVKNNKVIGTGFHSHAGAPHAEVIALRNVQPIASTKDATAYITLEPCCHHGRTPPCTDALITAGIKKVYIACVDPNPLVKERGIHALRSAGIQVEVGLLESDAKHLNEIFFHYIQTKLPFVISKWAMSLDGKTITHNMDAKAISGEHAKHKTHQLRQQVDAIVIGSKTALADDPQLTVRLPNEKAPIKHPLRIVLASKGNLPSHLKLFDLNSPANTLVVTTNQISDAWYQCMQKNNIEVLILPKDKHDEVDLLQLLIELGKREITSILVEGGMTLHQNFFKHHLVNKIHVYLAPYIIGSMEKKQIVKELSCSKIGADFYFTTQYEENKNV